MIPYEKLPYYARTRLRDYGDFSEGLDCAFEASFWENKADWLEYITYNDSDEIEAKIWESLGEERQKEIIAKIQVEIENQLKTITTLRQELNL